MFEDKLEIDGQIRIPVAFSVNGGKIIPEDKNPPYIECSMDRPLFPYLAFQYENSVLAKVSYRGRHFFYTWKRSCARLSDSIVGTY